MLVILGNAGGRPHGSSSTNSSAFRELPYPQGLRQQLLRQSSIEPSARPLPHLSGLGADFAEPNLLVAGDHLVAAFAAHSLW